MKIENQVCTLEQAKKLKELGVEQCGYWSYAHVVEFVHPSFNGEVTEWETEYGEEVELTETSLAQFDGRPYYSAFTVAELGVMLPKEFVTWFDGEHWHCSYGYDNPSHTIGLTESQVKAEELISRIESKWITPEEVNHRLKQ